MYLRNLVEFLKPFCSCPPRMFIPVLCKIFLDESAPDHVLEVTARALTYYLDVSADCARRLAAVDGSLQSIVQRVATVNIDSRPSKDLAEQCSKVCEIVYYSTVLMCFVGTGVSKHSRIRQVV